jgi:hypothetical protein
MLNTNKAKSFENHRARPDAFQMSIQQSKANDVGHSPSTLLCLPISEPKPTLHGQVQFLACELAHLSFMSLAANSSHSDLQESHYLPFQNLVAC